MADEIFSRPIRSLSHSSLHAVLTSLTMADESLSYLAAYELLDSAITGQGRDVTTWEAISATGRDPAAVQLDVDVCRRLGDAKRELERRAERSVKMLDNSVSVNAPQIDDDTYDRIRNQAPRPVYSRLRRARRLDRRYQGENGERAFAHDDLLHAESNRNLVADLEQSARTAERARR